MSKNVSFMPWSKRKSLNLYASTDDRWCNSIALHDFDIADIKWKEWFESSLSIFRKQGLEPTRLGISGSLYGQSSKTLTFNGGLRKLEKHDFAEIDSLVFMSMPNKNDYTSNFTIYAALYPDKINNIKSEMVISVDDKLEPYNKELFEQLAIKFHNFTKAKYGYYYHRHLTAEPDMYPGGGNVGFVNEEEFKLCKIWGYERVVYDHKGVLLRALYKTGTLRDIYKLNFLSSEHLNWKIGNNLTLGDWINSSKDHGQLTELSPSFWSWEVEDHLIPAVRQALIPSGIIICI